MSKQLNQNVMQTPVGTKPGDDVLDTHCDGCGAPFKRGIEECRHMPLTRAGFCDNCNDEDEGFQ
jgi:hypothetical protein